VSAGSNCYRICMFTATAADLLCARMLYREGTGPDAPQVKLELTSPLPGLNAHQTCQAILQKHMRSLLLAFDAPH